MSHHAGKLRTFPIYIVKTNFDGTMKKLITAVDPEFVYSEMCKLVEWLWLNAGGHANMDKLELCILAHYKLVCNAFYLKLANMLEITYIYISIIY